MINLIPITYEEGSDYNSKPVAKINGIALRPVTQTIAEKLNEIIEHLNRLDL